MWNLVITLDEYRQTLQELFELEMWYAGQAADDEKRPLNDTINQYTEFYYFSTEFNPLVPAAKNPSWQNVVMEIADSSASVWEIVAPYIEPRMEKDLFQAQNDIHGSYNGFMYEFCPEYESSSDEDFLTLHFRNYFAPESPFAHLDELKAGIGKIVRLAMKERPDVTQVQCASWLNNLPKFTSLFPKQWIERARFCYPMTASTGWWGYFIDRKGLINQKAVAEFKRTKMFRSPNRHCRCTVLELNDYLNN